MSLPNSQIEWGSMALGECSSESINRIDKELMLDQLGDYGKLLLQFQFEEAQSLVDNLRQTHSTINQNAIQDCAWLLLLHRLSDLAQAERSYFALSFLAAKSVFSRSKEPQVKHSYNQLRLGLQHAIELFRDYDALAAVEEEERHESTVEHLLNQFLQYVSARIQLMQCYETLLSQTHNAVNKETVARLNSIREQLEQYPVLVGQALLNPLHNSFNSELSILTHLLTAHMAIDSLQLMLALVSLKRAQSKLQSWLHNASLEATARHDRSSWFSFGASKKSLVALALCQWLRTLYECQLGRFSLYFHEFITKHNTDWRQQISTLPQQYNFTARLSSFARKHDLRFCALLMDGRGMCPPLHTTHAVARFKLNIPAHDNDDTPLIGDNATDTQQPVTGSDGISSYQVLYSHSGTTNSATSAHSQTPVSTSSAAGNTDQAASTSPYSSAASQLVYQMLPELVMFWTENAHFIQQSCATECSGAGNKSSALVSLYNQERRTGVLFGGVNERLVLLLAVHGTLTDKQTQVMQQFLLDTVCQLRAVPLFAALRQGIK